MMHVKVIGVHDLINEPQFHCTCTHYKQRDVYQVNIQLHVYTVHCK